MASTTSRTAQKWRELPGRPDRSIHPLAAISSVLFSGLRNDDVGVWGT